MCGGGDFRIPWVLRDRLTRSERHSISGQIYEGMAEERWYVLAMLVLGGAVRSSSWAVKKPCDDGAERTEMERWIDDLQ